MQEKIMPLRINDSVCCDHVHTDSIEHIRFPNEAMTKRLSAFFRTFGDNTRLKILLALGQQELCVCDIGALIGMEQSAVSHQLRFLKKLHIVKTRREGKSIFYALDDGHVNAIIDQGLAHIAHQGTDFETEEEL